MAMLSQTFSYLYETFWSENFWLGDGARWDDLISDDPSVYYPKLSDMNWSIVVGAILVFARHLWDKFLIHPLANSLGLRERKNITLVPSPVLEAYYKTSGWKPNKVDLQGLVKQTDLTQRQVERWLLKRRVRDLPSTMYKFKECSWQVLFYTAASLWGIYSLWRKPYLWVTVNCWVGWPKQHVETDIFTLYLIELSFYWSLLFAMVFGKDYHKGKKEMVLHHIITILLIYFSWAVNMVRVGSLVILVHDIADPWINLVKMAKYVKWDRTAEVLFTIFMIIWIVSRLFVYPLWVLNASAIEIYDYVISWPAYWIFNGLLVFLQILHIWWTYLLLSIAFQQLTTRDVEKDSRSESDPEISDSSEEEKSSSPVTLPAERAKLKSV